MTNSSIRILTAVLQCDDDTLFGKEAARASRTTTSISLAERQSALCDMGAGTVALNLIVSSGEGDESSFLGGLNLAIALLNGGNSDVQAKIPKEVQDPKSGFDRLPAVLRSRLKLAAKEVRNKRSQMGWPPFTIPKMGWPCRS